MSKPKPIQINIANPCSESWDEMASAVNGRHCDHCQKIVIDFTTYSDAALYSFFSKNTDHVCGRFFVTQLDRRIAIPHQPHSQLYRITIALGLTLLFTQTPQLLAQNRPPKNTQTTNSYNNPKEDSTTTPTTTEIKGRVLDEKKEPLINAVIQVFENNVLKGSNMTDYDGNYSIKPLEEGYYDISVTYQGYKDIHLPAFQLGYNTPALNFMCQKRKGTDTSMTYQYPVVKIENSDSRPITKDKITSISMGVFTDLVASSMSAKNEIKGQVLDEKKEPLISATIQLYQNNSLINSTITDYDGNYKIDSLKPGVYELLVTYVSYDSTKLTVEITRDKSAQQNFQLTTKNKCVLGAWAPVEYKIPLRNMDDPGKKTLNRNDINRMPH